MSGNRRNGPAAGAVTLALLLLAMPVGAAETETTPGAVTGATIEALMPVLAAACPLAAPEDAAAFERCRSALAEAPALRRWLREEVLWGDPQPDTAFWQLKLAPFARESFTTSVLPLFMFSGAYRVTREGTDSWVELRARVAFRNRLPARHYPLPLDAVRAGWAALQATNELVMRIDPAAGAVWTLLRSHKPDTEPLVPGYAPADPPAADGQ